MSSMYQMDPVYNLHQESSSSGMDLQNRMGSQYQAGSQYETDFPNKYQYQVPNGMSCVNVFHVLWENSRPAPFFELFPEQEALHAASVSTPQKVADLFRMKLDFNYEGGRLIGIDFSEFPKLNTTLYNRNFGEGLAEKVIELYSKVHTSQRFDKNDSYQIDELYIFKNRARKICNQF